MAACQVGMGDCFKRLAGTTTVIPWCCIDACQAPAYTNCKLQHNKKSSSTVCQRTAVCCSETHQLHVRTHSGLI